jgi:hypothetical protein
VRRAGAVALALLPLAACDVDEASWRGLHREVVPASSAPWQSIPWRLDLAAARAEAASTGRPLFFWAMNGHPCGCT